MGKKKDKGKKKSGQPHKQKRAPKIKESKVAFSDEAFAAEVVEIIGKIGGKQGGQQVRCKVLEGGESGKVIRRNVLGPIKAGDILMLKETEIEASPLKGRKR